MDPRVEKIMTAAEYIAAKLDGRKPVVGIVLGSGVLFYNLNCKKEIFKGCG